MKYQTHTNKKNFYAWIPAVLWTVVVTALTLLPVVIIFALIHMMPSTGGQVHHLLKDLVATCKMFGIKLQIDKLAHFGMHFILGILLVLGCEFSGFGLSFKSLSCTGFIGAGYGIFAEFMQKPSATRSFSMGDMHANLMGFACGFIAGIFLAIIVKIIKLPFKMLRMFLAA